ncbi:TPA: hypothetical protein ACRMZW_004291 [Pseudomonas aeruginosa]
MRGVKWVHPTAEQWRDGDRCNLAVLNRRQIPEHGQQCAVCQQRNNAGGDGQYLEQV